MKTLLSMSLASKFIHNIDDNVDLDLTFDEHFSGVMYMVIIYTMAIVTGVIVGYPGVLGFANCP